jgi:hypothetical protein
MAHHGMATGSHADVNAHVEPARAAEGKKGKRAREAGAGGSDNLAQKKVEIPLHSQRLVNGLTGRPAAWAAERLPSEKLKGSRKRTALQCQHGGGQV